MNRIPWLGPNEAFPNPLFTSDPDSTVPGLFAVSERIYPDQLQTAYQLGLFPWYSNNQPVLWWSPDPRMVLVPTQFKCSDSLKKTLRHFLVDTSKTILVDYDFSAVVRACATSTRKDQDGTWITHEIVDAYTALFEQGNAHCIAVMDHDILIGGLYCVCFGKAVFGESMFSKQTDSSKIALAALCAFCAENGVPLIDCQQETAHLRSLGASPIKREAFLQLLQSSLNQTKIELPWTFTKAILQHWL